MKLKHFYSAIIIVLSLTMAGCEKVLEIDTDGLQRYVVANAMLCGDSTMFVNVSYSRFFLDNRQFKAVEYAQVVIDVNGTTISYDYRDGANYWFDSQCHQGDSLTLHVTVDGMETTGGTRVPYRAIVSEPTAIIDTTLSLMNYDITFTLSDRGGEKNWYYVYIVERDSGIKWNRQERQWDTIDTIANPVFLCLNEKVVSPGVNFSEGLMMYYQHLLFSDSLIDGDEVEIIMSMPKMRDTAEHEMKRTYKLVVKSMSREAFLYTKDILAASSATQYFAEQGEVYSNLRGAAIGVFAAMTRWERMLEFEFRSVEPPDNQNAKLIEQIYRQGDDGKSKSIAGGSNYSR